jgi:hypothetical protein
VYIITFANTTQQKDSKMNANNTNARYDIVRFYENSSSRIVLRNLTLEEAKKHCNDLETSSSTCTLPSRKAMTKRHGRWFDAYTVSKS